MKKLLFLFIILISLVVPCYGQNDQTINGRNINVTFDTSLPWSSLSNKTYIMAPLGPDYGFCVSLINNNTTSSHTFTVTAFQTGDNNVVDYSHNTGRFASLAIVGNPSPIAANTTQTFFVRSNGAAKIAFNFTGGSTQAGSPDTADIFAVQTTAAGCGTVNPQTGQQYTLATPNTGTSASTPFAAISDGIGQSFIVSHVAGGVVNPGAGSVPLAIFLPGGSTRSIYLERLVLSCSATCVIKLGSTNTQGTTCSAITPQAVKLSGPASPQSTANTGCTTVPVFAGFFAGTYFIAANTPFTIDLKGMIVNAPGNGFALDMQSALVGTLNAQFFYYEK